jgi:hypothetical protein
MTNDTGESHANLLSSLLPHIWPTPDDTGEVQQCRNAAWVDIVMGDFKVRIMVNDAKPDQPLWNTEPFTEEDRKVIWNSVYEQVRDDIGETATDMCQRMGFNELAGYLVNLELLLPYHKLQNPPDGMTTEELLADIAQEPAEDHAELIRLGLLVEDETVIGGYRITDLGVDVLQEWY